MLNLDELILAAHFCHSMASIKTSSSEQILEYLQQKCDISRFPLKNAAFTNLGELIGGGIFSALARFWPQNTRVDIFAMQMPHFKISAKKIQPLQTWVS